LTNTGNTNKNTWLKIIQQGHEVGNHTVNHNSNGTWTLSQWQTEINNANNWIIGNLGVAQADIWGFRTPSLDYNSNTFTALTNIKFIYDCSLHGGSATTGDGSNYNWPYTLDSGSPGETAAGTHAGLWEIPTHHVVRTDGTKVIGLDYNMWVKKAAPYLQSEMSQAEFVATLKNTLDLRYNGNRAPMTFGAHSDYYSPTNSDANNASTATWQQRRAGLRAFVDYALTKPDVRFVTTKDIIKWMRNPVGLRSTGITAEKKPASCIVSVVKHGNDLEIRVPAAGVYAIKIFSTNGALIAEPGKFLMHEGRNTVHAGAGNVRFQTSIASVRGESGNATTLIMHP
jgi:hypothetical protein